MAIETIPIPAPLLDERDAERIAAEAIARVNELCPELSNNDPGRTHVVLAENQAWHVEQAKLALNRLPELVLVEFARLFGIELRLATRATTTLTFTVAPPAGLGVTIPAGTRVADSGGVYVFETLVDLPLAPATAAGTVEAERRVGGVTSLAAGTLTNLLDPVAFVTAVTNAQAVDGGSERETVEQALQRARNYQQRAERIVSARDLETAILDEVMPGGAVMRIFEKTEDGYWGVNDLGRRLGNTTVVLMTPQGLAVGAEVRQQLSALAAQMIGGQNLFVKDPVYHDFNVGVIVRLTDLSRQETVRAHIEASLRAFYGARAGNFGRQVLRSEIIELIEGTSGVDAIVPQPGGAILASPSADVELLPYELPRLVTVTLNFVV